MGLILWAIISFIALFFLIRSRKRNGMIADVSSRHVFITGCDTGFGRLLAEHLDHKGVKVYAGCYLEKSLQMLSQKCSTNLKPILIDISNSASVKKAVEIVKKDLRNKSLWALINNAGVFGSIGPIEFFTKKSIQSVLDVNLLGTIDVTLQFLPLIKKGKEGRIVNMSSMAGRIGLQSGGYTISKYGIEAFSDGLSLDLAPYGLTVHVVNPSMFNTGFSSLNKTNSLTRQMWDNLPQTVQDEFGHEFIDEYLDAFKKFYTALVSNDFHKVVSSYADAILNQNPKNRYYVGGGSQLLLLYSILPINWQIKIHKYVKWTQGAGTPVPLCLKNIK